MAEIHQLLDYGTQVLIRDLNRVGIDGARIFEDGIKEECPVDTGALLASVEVDEEMINVGEDYASFVEEGHTCKNGTVVPPDPFIERGIDRAQDEVDKLLGG
jgi:hypothetical protein